MEITYVFRPKERNAFSIETVFWNIIPYIKRNNTVNIYYYDPSKSLLKNIKQIKKISKGIIHITGDVNFLALFLPKNRTVLTIHDIGHIRTLKGIKSIIFTIVWYLLPINRLNYLTSITRFTKDDICKTFKINCNKIEIINNAVSDDFKYKYKEFNKKEPNILQIGTKPNKNIPRLIKAISNINCKLTIIGKIDSYTKELLHSNNIKYENYYNLTKEQIIEQYTNSDIVAFVSTFEGFGMPIIEANAMGRAIITSNIEPMKSIAEKAAHLVNPFSEIEIESGIKKIIEDEEYRNYLITGGLENANKYSVKKISNDYIHLYKKMIVQK